MNNRKGQEGLGALIGVIFVVIVVVGFIGMMLGFDTVEANHLGVKIAWGKVIGSMQPGTLWTGVFTHVEQYNMRTRQIQIDLAGDNFAPAKTGQAIYATINVNYRIKPSEDTVINLYKNIGTDTQIEEVLNLKPIIVEAFKQTTVNYDAIDVLANRQQIKDQTIEKIKTNFPKDYFEILDVVVTNIDWSKGFKDAIEAKQVAEQNAIMEKNKLEVVKYQQQQALEVAKVEAQKMSLQRSELNDLLIQQAWISKWDGKMPITYVSAGSDNTPMMILPIGNGTVVN